MSENKINPKFRAIDIDFSCSDNKLYDNDIYISSSGDIYEKAYPSYDTPNLEIECVNRKLCDVEISLDNEENWYTMTQLKDFIHKNNTRTEDKRIEKALEYIEKTMKIIHDSSCFDAEIIAVKALLEINTIKSILKGEA